ncbi:MAG: deoxyribonuclease IV [Agathobacter sp.]|nr:deoxyribonuclease IV [Agathobacter sp.]
MIYIGSHISASGGFAEMGKTALKLGADTFAFFTRNPRGGKAKDIDEKDVAALQQIMDEHNFGPLVAHAPYTMNLCSDKADIRKFAKDMFADDMKRMEYLPGNYYNFHPGSHVGQGVETGIDYIVEAMNEVLFPEMKTMVLLEGMAGKGSEIGRNFEELRAIIDKVELKDKVGVCLDTCHLWEAGYDIVTKLDEVLELFDQIVGADRLRAIHLNDSKNPIEAHKDRHELLGEGHIGKDALAAVIRHPRLQGKPFILETPNDDAGYAKEIAWVRSVMQ